MNIIIIIYSYIYYICIQRAAAVCCLRVYAFAIAAAMMAFSWQHPQRRISHVNNAFCKNPPDQINYIRTRPRAHTHTNPFAHNIPTLERKTNNPIINARPAVLVLLQSFRTVLYNNNILCMTKYLPTSVNASKN